MIIAKPSGLPVLPGGGFLQNTLLYQLQQRYPQEMPVPVHRLGRGTSGLMLIARSSLAKSKLSQQMRDRQISKIYRALIGPSELPTEFTINQGQDFPLLQLNSRECRTRSKLQTNISFINTKQTRDKS